MKAKAEFCSNLGQCKELSEVVYAQRAVAQSVTGDCSQKVGKLSGITHMNFEMVAAIGAQTTPAWNSERK